MKTATLLASRHLRTLSLLATVATAALAAAGPNDPIVPSPFVDFSRSKEAGYLSFNSATFNAITTDSYGTWLDATYTGKWSGVSKSFATPVDYSGYNGITLAMRNYENRRVRVNVRFDTTPNNASSGAYSMYVWLPANETTMVLFESGAVDPLTKGMYAAPPMGTCDLPLCRMVIPALNLKTVYKVSVYNGDTASQRVAISRLGGIQYTQNWSNLTDVYGQYTARTYPGKVTQDSDLATSASNEALDLAQNPPRADLGGVADPALTATGRWGVYKSAAGNWFFKTPDGKRFWSMGLHGVHNYETSLLTNRDDMFNLPSSLTLPGSFTSIDTATGQLQFDYLRANLSRKYGVDWADAWGAKMVTRMKSWGFNTAGAGSDPNIARTGLPHIEMISSSSLPVKLTTKFTTLIDPFAPNVTAALVAQWMLDYPQSSVRNDPTLMGVYVDNEMYWGYTLGSYWERYSVPVAVIASPITQPSKAFFVSELQTRYGTVAKVNAIYGKSFATWSDVGAPWDVTTSDSTNWYVNRDISSLLANYAGRYSWEVRDAIRAVFPSALYMGGRNQPETTPQEIYTAMDQMVDIHSMNLYGDANVVDWSVVSNLTKPTMISEFAFSFQNGAGSDALCGSSVSTLSPTAAQAGDRITRYLLKAASLPNVVGIQYFKAVDEVVTARNDGESATMGMLTITDSPKYDLIKPFRSLASQIYSIRQ